MQSYTGSIATLPSSGLAIAVGQNEVRVPGAGSLSATASTKQTTTIDAFEGSAVVTSPGEPGSVSIEVPAYLPNHPAFEILEAARKADTVIPIKIRNKGQVLFGDLSTSGEIHSYDAAGTVEAAVAIAATKDATGAFDPDDYFAAATFTGSLVGQGKSLDLNAGQVNRGDIIRYATGAGAAGKQVADTDKITVIGDIGNAVYSKVAVPVPAAAVAATNFVILRPSFSFAFSARVTSLSPIPSFSAGAGNVASANIELAPLSDEVSMTYNMAESYYL